MPRAESDRSQGLRFVAVGVRCAALCVFGAGVAAAIGWPADLQPLRALGTEHQPMAPGAAVGFALAGLALWLRVGDETGAVRRRSAILASFGVVVLGAATLLDTAVGSAVEHHVLLVGALHTTTTPLMSACGLIEIGLALLLADVETRGHHRPTQILGFVACLQGLVGVLGYAIDPGRLPQFPGYASMGFASAVALVVCGCALVVIRPRAGVMIVLLDDGITGLVVRRLLPFAFGVPLMLPIVLASGIRMGFGTPEFDAAFTAAVSIAVLGVAVSLTGRSMLILDRERLDLLANLERQVEVRTREVRTSELQLRAVLDTTNAAIFMIDDTGVVLSANRATYDIFGYAPDEITGVSVEVLLEDREELDALRDALVGGPDENGRDGTHLAVACHEVDGRRADGTVVPLQVEVNDVWIDGQHRFVALAQEITARRATEAALAQRTQELVEMNEELEAFSYSVSHDLRAPLRAVDGFCAVLVEDHGDHLDEDAQFLVRRARAAAQRMGVLIDDMLELSHVNRVTLDRAAVDLSGLAEEIAGSLRSRDEARRVEVQIEPGMVATGDPRLVPLLLENLLENAWKFTAREHVGRIRVETAPIDGQVHYAVTDNGVGFDPAYGSRLFEPFQRLHRAEDFPGTGVGLATVKRIVTRHGGDVWGQPNDEGGATFVFRLEGAVSDARRP